ncbi:hypothetical protein NSK_003932 [Nannochloropsis salina CCMP1776]|uniref:WAPL domain-containing protein n=1 Tax=Nannochloropsis salina CCMP1776 TaxID=1027361 RepID=A0A4D9D0K1_9STRA|nr:hypothetical protein NSK_003932 [Nannochloropsis salina CCMP1776]|eukprot:TFJ84900.1 hypothetical protein NSK_003932 [Nannochloropsis salina CCMP1776]
MLRRESCSCAGAMDAFEFVEDEGGRAPSAVAPATEDRVLKQYTSSALRHAVKSSPSSPRPRGFSPTPAKGEITSSASKRQARAFDALRANFVTSHRPARLQPSTGRLVSTPPSSAPSIAITSSARAPAPVPNLLASSPPPTPPVKPSRPTLASTADNPKTDAKHEATVTTPFLAVPRFPRYPKPAFHPPPTTSSLPSSSPSHTSSQPSSASAPPTAALGPGSLRGPPLPPPLPVHMNPLDDPLPDLLRLLDAAGPGQASRALRRTKALEFLKTVGSPLVRAYFHQHPSTGLGRAKALPACGYVGRGAAVAQLFAALGAAMAPRGKGGREGRKEDREEEEVQACLVGGVFFLLKNGANREQVPRTVVAGTVRLLRESGEGEEGRRKRGGRGGGEGGGGRGGGGRGGGGGGGEGGGGGGGEGGGRGGGGGPRFGRRKFAAVRSSLWEEVKALIAEEEEKTIEELGGVGKLGVGQLALMTMRRLLREEGKEDEEEDEEEGEEREEGDVEGEDEEAEEEGEEDEVVDVEEEGRDFERQGSRSGGGRQGGSGAPGRGAGKERGWRQARGRRGAKEGWGEKAEGGEGEEGPGSAVWRMKEYLRSEGGLPLLERMVREGIQTWRVGLGQAGREGGRAGELCLRLEVVESAVYQNVDNQAYMGKPRGGGGEEGGREEGREGGRGRGPSSSESLVETLMAVVQVCLEGGREGETEGGRAGAEDQDDVVEEGGGKEGRREGGREGTSRDACGEEVLLSTLRVLVNLSHLNPQVVRQVAGNKGVETLVTCWLSHTRLSFLREVREATLPEPPAFSPSSSPRGSPLPPSTATASGNSSPSSEKPRPSPRRSSRNTLPPPPSPPSPPCSSAQAGPGNASFDVQLLTLTALTNCLEKDGEARRLVGRLRVKQGGRCWQVVEGVVAEEGSMEGREKDVPLVGFLTQCLLLLVRPFAGQLAKALKPETTRREGGGEEEEGEEEEEEAFSNKQAEELVLAGYTALLLGCMMREDAPNRNAILSFLPHHCPHLLVRVLKAFLAFQQSLGVLTSSVMAPVLEMIAELEAPPISSRLPPSRSSTSSSDDGITPARTSSSSSPARPFPAAAAPRSFPPLPPLLLPPSPFSSSVRLPSSTVPTSPPLSSTTLPPTAAKPASNRGHLRSSSPPFPPPASSPPSCSARTRPLSTSLPSESGPANRSLLPSSSNSRTSPSSNGPRGGGNDTSTPASQVSASSRVIGLEGRQKLALKEKRIGEVDEQGGKKKAEEEKEEEEEEVLVLGTVKVRRGGQKGGQASGTRMRRGRGGGTRGGEEGVRGGGGKEGLAGGGSRDGSPFSNRGAGGRGRQKEGRGSARLGRDEGGGDECRGTSRGRSRKEKKRKEEGGREGGGGTSRCLISMDRRAERSLKKVREAELARDD